MGHSLSGARSTNWNLYNGCHLQSQLQSIWLLTFYFFLSMFRKIVSRTAHCEARAKNTQGTIGFEFLICLVHGSSRYNGFVKIFFFVLVTQCKERAMFLVLCSARLRGHSHHVYKFTQETST